MPLFKKQVQQFAAQAKADKLRFEDPNHVIDEDYAHINRVCAERLNSSDFGQPKPTGKGYIIIGGMFVMAAMVFLYSCQPAVAGVMQ